MSNSHNAPADPMFKNIDDWAEALVGEGKLAHTQTAIFKSGATIHTHRTGVMDITDNTPLLGDAIFRIYSMTKPVTAVAVMMLVEDGLCAIDDPVANYIPAFANGRVYLSGGPDDYKTEPARGDMTIKHLLTHTGGLIYANQASETIKTLYKRTGVDFSAPHDSFADAVDSIAGLPLVCHPGTGWNYSVSHDVLGRLIEVISGQPFDQFLRMRILEPLRMVDTGFQIEPAKHHRLVKNYGYDENGRLKDISDYSADRFLRGGTLLSGGGGLVSTAADYLRFARMMLNCGELDGARLLKPETVALMTTNHVDGDIPDMGELMHSGYSMAGIGFGLIGAVMLDPARSVFAGSKGDYCWGGAASTYFWIDPLEDMVVVFLTQLMPSSALPLRQDL
ncbi:MAG: beta-lactamase family protein, partial [Rhodospirillaceae bacterium]|nr:beta-lactamase family protein [Rhodospirillaceae bacterium]